MTVTIVVIAFIAGMAVIAMVYRMNRHRFAGYYNALTRRGSTNEEPNVQYRRVSQKRSSSQQLALAQRHSIYGHFSSQDVNDQDGAENLIANNNS